MTARMDEKIAHLDFDPDPPPAAWKMLAMWVGAPAVAWTIIGLVVWRLTR